MRIDGNKDRGEIVVSGPTVMEGYLGQEPVHGEWYTGELGYFKDGQLVVLGRKVWLIVTPEGRNISPEWVESRLTADPRIPAAGLHLSQDGTLHIVAAITEPVPAADIARRLEDLPPYARPRAVVCVPANLDGLLKPGGGIDRSRLGDLCASQPSQTLFDNLELSA